MFVVTDAIGRATERTKGERVVSGRRGQAWQRWRGLICGSADPRTCSLANSDGGGREGHRARPASRRPGAGGTRGRRSRTQACNVWPHAAGRRRGLAKVARGRQSGSSLPLFVQKRWNRGLDKRRLRARWVTRSCRSAPGNQSTDSRWGGHDRFITNRGRRDVSGGDATRTGSAGEARPVGHADRERQRERRDLCRITMRDRCASSALADGDGGREWQPLAPIGTPGWRVAAGGRWLRLPTRADSRALKPPALRNRHGGLGPLLGLRPAGGLEEAASGKASAGSGSGTRRRPRCRPPAASAAAGATTLSPARPRACPCLTILHRFRASGDAASSRLKPRSSPGAPRVTRQVSPPGKVL